MKDIDIKLIRTNKEWERAGVHFVRTKTMVEGFEFINLEEEFREDTSGAEYILAMDGKHAVGTCRLHILDKDNAKIERVVVIPEYQGKDVGKKIIAAAEDWLAEKGISKITITSIDVAIGFYEKLGYKADYNAVIEDDVFRQIYAYKTITPKAPAPQNFAAQGSACSINRKPNTSGAEQTFTSLFKAETNDKGQFVRQPVHFTKAFGGGKDESPIEKDRYRLIVSKACPWAHRQLIARKLLGLEDVISVGVVDPIRPAKEYSDWAFTLDEGGVDPVLKVHEVSELYLKSDPSYEGRFTVPSVVDLTTGKIVNNDFFNLTYYWETAWKPFHKEGAPNLFPEDLRSDIEALNEIIFHEVNNGVYKAGFAASQEAYHDAYQLVFNRLDDFEKRLAGKRFLFGDRLTDSDIRLWVTLVRFDIAYYNAFRVNRNRLIDFKNLWRYAKEIYQIPAFKETTDFDHIKRHYHLCCVPSNNYKIVPEGPDLSVWEISK